MRNGTRGISSSRDQCMKPNTRFLYSVWRNEDDRLMILDGTADECARIMQMERGSFYRICNGGGNGAWTVMKESVEEIQLEMNG